MLDYCQNFQFLFLYFAGSSRRSPASATPPTELSLWRDSQAVQAYLGPITKLPSPSSWATRTAASCAFANNSHNPEQQKGQEPLQEENHYEEIMELKRQLAHTSQDLHLTKVCVNF